MFIAIKVVGVAQDRDRSFQKRLEGATKSTERSSFHKSTLFETPLPDPFKSRFEVFERRDPSHELDSSARE
jgi:hypothetical protein